MSHQGHTQSSVSPLSLTALANLSPHSGALSVVSMTICCFVILTLLLVPHLLPNLGSFGSFLIAGSISLAVERISRPLVLWALGRNVYNNLIKLGGKSTADEVAVLYAAGGAINSKQLNALVERNTKKESRIPKDQSR